MELLITAFFNSCAPMDYSASVAEIGRTAGADTWRAACEGSPENMILDTDEKREAFRWFVKSAGAWSIEEIAAWSNVELNALCIQWIAGDMRECGIGPESSDGDWSDYQTRAENGNCPSRIFRADDGAVYFEISE